MDLESFSNEALPTVEQELQDVIYGAYTPETAELRDMLTYHLGWEGEGAGPKATGKRVRPLLLLLCTRAAGGDWKKALPAAAAVELLHNFSLIHDDIQDQSKTRRGRPTVWHKWGEAQAINAGDAMFAIAHIALERLEKDNPPEIYLQAIKLLPRTSLHLTQGQYLDLAYESSNDLEVADYWPMVLGKTAVLLSTCTELGALVGGADADKMAAYRLFGEKLGLAFQVHDDLLGIWGVAEETGKSAHSDLESGKKSLPVLYGLTQGGEFASHWNNGAVSEKQVEKLAEMLEAEGARQFGEQEAERLTQEALDSLDQAQPDRETAEALNQLAEQLVKRKS